jgi:hypothetical protein
MRVNVKTTCLLSVVGMILKQEISEKMKLSKMK